MAKERFSVAVEAPPEVIFGLLERERTELRSDELVQWERVGSAPFGAGYGYKATVLHRGNRCPSYNRVTKCDAPRILEEEWSHHCRTSGKTLTGSQRFEILPDGTGSILVAEFVTRKPGLAGVLAALGLGCGSDKSRLARFALHAEAIARSGSLEGS